MKILEAQQGSPEWLAHRASHFNASDAPAMMGLSPYKTRSEALHQQATGITAEIDPSTQRRFDAGHRFEELARPLAEKIIGEDLFPVVGYEGKLSASFDGLTMDGSTCWEHKTINAVYRQAIDTGSPLPPALVVQIEQQLMVSGATRCLFTATAWEGDVCVEAVERWVESDPELRKRIVAGWAQFAIDLENYQHAEATASPVAAAIEALPALLVQVEGRVLATNLDAFKVAAQTFIDCIKTELVNDQDFADADKMVKFLKDGEDRLAQCKQHALAQTASIDELFRTVDSISEQMRSKRLALDKLVKAEKENRRAEIVRNATFTINQHVAKLNERIGGNWMPLWSMHVFSDAIKGLKSLDSMRDKVSAELANEKIAANEIADRIERNAKYLKSLETPYDVAPDFAAICTKEENDFANLIARRVTAIKEAEAEKAEAAKKAEDARVAAAVEAERKAGEARAAAEADRITKEAVRADAQAKAQAATVAPIINQQTATDEVKRASVVAAQDDIADFVNSRNFGTTSQNQVRAILVEFVKFKAERSL